MIKKIVIELQGKDIELTLEEAKQLKAELDELFKVEVQPSIPSHPFFPINPLIGEPYRSPYRVSEFPYHTEPIWCRSQSEVTAGWNHTTTTAVSESKHN